MLFCKGVFVKKLKKITTTTQTHNDGINNMTENSRSGAVFRYYDIKKALPITGSAYTLFFHSVNINIFTFCVFP